jgi:hypothetical protein
MLVSATLTPAQSRVFNTGWIVLLLSAALMTLNHLVLTFVRSETALFLGWTAFNLYALLVVAVPFRRLEKWAWYATWILPVGLAAGAFTDPHIAIYYYSVAAGCVLGLLLTMRGFFAIQRQTLQQLS